MLRRHSALMSHRRSGRNSDSLKKGPGSAVGESATTVLAPHGRLSHYQETMSGGHQLCRETISKQRAARRSHTSTTTTEHSDDHATTTTGASDSSVDRQLVKMFHLADLNQDGLVDFSDLNQLLKQLNMYATRKQVCAMIRAYDPADTGGLDFDRFCRMMRGAPRLNKETETEQLFNAFNRNGSGQVTRTEARETLALVSEGSAVSSGDLDEMFEALDSDRNGVITLEEFKAIEHYLN